MSPGTQRILNVFGSPVKWQIGFYSKNKTHARSWDKNPGLGVY